MGQTLLKTRSFKIFTAVCLTTLGLAACSSGPTSSGDKSQSGTAGGSSHATASSHTGDLTIAIGKAVTTLNADTAATNDQASAALFLVADPLWKQLPSGELGPGLASSVTHNTDGTVWTFHIRDGAKFSNGTPVTSADVKFTYQNEMKQPLEGANYKNITKIETPDPSTVVFTTNQPDGAFLDTAANFAVCVIPKDFGGQSEKSFWENPIGSGAFTVESLEPGKQLVLKKNPSYYQAAKTKVNKITMIGVADANTAALKLQNGAVNAIATVAASGVDSLSARHGVTVREVPNAASYFLTLNSAKPPLNNRDVRRAISLALNRSDMVKSALLGKGTVAGSWLGAEDLDGYVPAFGKQYDLAKAKALLATTPYAKGFDLTFVYPSTDTIVSDCAQVIKAELAKLGINVKLEGKSQNAVSADVTARKFDMTSAFIEWTGDPYLVLGYYAGTQGFGSNEKDVAAKVGSMTNKALAVLDDTQRMKEYQQIIDYIAEGATLIGLVSPTSYMATGGNIADIPRNNGVTYWGDATFK